MPEKKEAWEFSNNILNAFLVIMILMCGICFLFAPNLVSLVAPGFPKDQLSETVLLTRIMFASPIIFGVTSIISGILQYFNRFLAYGLAPIFYNIGIIAGILFLAPFFGILGVAYGVIIGVCLHFLVQLPAAVNSGFSYKFILKFRDPLLKKAVWLMLPRAFSVAASQLNLTVALFIASGLAVGSITIFNFASNVYSLPVSIIGVSFALAAFPVFSKLYAEKNFGQLAKKFSLAFRQLGFVVIPVAILMWLLREPIIALIYRHGQFTFQAAALTSAGLALLSIGIYFISEVQLIYRMFFALKDTITPALITFAAVAIGIGSSFLFVDCLGQENFLSNSLKSTFNLEQVQDIRILGLAIAFTLAIIAQFVMASVFLRQKNGNLILIKEISLSLAKISAAGFIMALAVLFMKASFAAAINPLAEIIFYSFIGTGVYLLVLYLLKSEDIESCKTIPAKIFGRFQK